MLTSFFIFEIASTFELQRIPRRSLVGTHPIRCSAGDRAPRPYPPPCSFGQQHPHRLPPGRRSPCSECASAGMLRNDRDADGE